MKTILIVEDDKVVAAAYRQRFTEAGFKVELAQDGLEGIRMVTSVPADVVLLDLLMPRLDGLEVLKYIRGHPDLKQLPVIVFSNSYMTNMIENAWRAGANQCLMKASSTPSQVLDAVKKVLQRANLPPGAPLAAQFVPPVTPLSRPPAATGLPVASLGPTAPMPSSPQSLRPVVVPSAPNMRPPLAPQARSSGTFKAEADPEFQAQIRQLFIGSAGEKLSSIRESASACIQAAGSPDQLAPMRELFQRVHAFIGNAAVAGCMQVAQVAGTYEAFLQELQQQPRFLNQSTLRTLAGATEFLDFLIQSTTENEMPPDRLPSALVLENDSGAAQAAAAALERGGFKTNVANDPAHALALLASLPCDFAVVAGDLPGMNGLEFCAQMQTLDENARTPVVFVTSLTDFDAYTAEDVIGENDAIARPFLLIELTLKGIIAWHRKNLVPVQ